MYMLSGKLYVPTKIHNYYVRIYFQFYQTSIKLVETINWVDTVDKIEYKQDSNYNINDNFYEWVINTCRV